MTKIKAKNNRLVSMEIHHKTSLLKLNTLCYEQTSPLDVSHTPSGAQNKVFTLFCLSLSILHYFSPAPQKGCSKTISKNQFAAPSYLFNFLRPVNNCAVHIINGVTAVCVSKLLCVFKLGKGADLRLGIIRRFSHPVFYG